MLKQKKILKLFFISLFIGVSLSYAKLVNGISVLVNNEPITLYEIHKLAQIQNISLKQSLNILIEKRLEQSEIKKYRIKPSNYEINKEIEEKAKKNKLSKGEFLDFITSQGISEKKYRANIASGIASKKLFKRIFGRKDPTPTEVEVKTFFQKNPANFTKATAFNVTTYYSHSKSDLIKAMENPMSVENGVKIKQERLNTNKMNGKLEYFLNKAKKNNFIPIIKTKKGYLVYQVHEKLNPVPMTYEESRPLIIRFLSRQNQQTEIKNYFQKLRSSAVIEVLRKP